MGAFGDRLQREREMRGITLDEIAEATKIGTRSLRALEAEDFDKLPGGIFNKGFVRAYARYLGIDEEQAVADYMVAVREAEAPSAEPVQAIAAAKQNKQAAAKLAQSAEASADSEPAGAPWMVFVVIVVIAALAAGAWYFYNRHQRQQAASAAVLPEAPPAPPPPATLPPTSSPPDTTAAAAAASPAPVSTDAATTVKSPASADVKSQAPPSADYASGFLLHIHALEDSWMKITADGKVIIPGETLKASADKDIRAQKQIVLTVGNAGGVTLTHNGKAVASLGAENKTRTVTFTPEGMQQ